MNEKEVEAVAFRVLVAVEQVLISLDRLLQQLDKKLQTYPAVKSINVSVN